AALARVSGESVEAVESRFLSTATGNIQEEIQKRDELLAKARNALREIHKENNDLSIKAEALAGELTDTRAQLSAVRTSHAEAQRDLLGLTDVKTECEVLTRQLEGLAGLRSDYAASQRALGNAEHSLALAETERDRLRLEATEREKAYNTLQGQLQQALRDAERERGDAATLRGELQSVSGASSDTASELAACQEALEEARRAGQACESTSAQLRGDLTAVQAEHSELLGVCDQLKQKLVAMEVWRPRAERSEESCRLLAKQYRKKEDMYRQAMAQRQTLKTHIDDLLTSNEEAEATQRSLEASLAASRKREREGSSAAEHRGHEKGTAAVLGQLLSVAVSGPTAVFALLNELRRRHTPDAPEVTLPVTKGGRGEREREREREVGGDGPRGIEDVLGGGPSSGGLMATTPVRRTSTRQERERERERMGSPRGGVLYATSPIRPGVSMSASPVRHVQREREGDVQPKRVVLLADPLPSPARPHSATHSPVRHPVSPTPHGMHDMQHDVQHTHGAGPVPAVTRPEREAPTHPRREEDGTHRLASTVTSTALVGEGAHGHVTQPETQRETGGTPSYPEERERDALLSLKAEREYRADHLLHSTQELIGSIQRAEDQAETIPITYDVNDVGEPIGDIMARVSNICKQVRSVNVDLLGSHTQPLE
ncbi:hypothetical protein KIPB_009127, partial [Kipferlia bialata]